IPTTTLPLSFFLLHHLHVEDLFSLIPSPVTSLLFSLVYSLPRPSCRPVPSPPKSTGSSTALHILSPFSWLLKATEAYTLKSESRWDFLSSLCTFVFLNQFEFEP
ncbi:hypothetical protein HAX54_030888, partial [Datura stramonium]|nr:hypothetical protein [Datura stramonium]